MSSGAVAGRAGVLCRAPAARRRLAGLGGTVAAVSLAISAVQAPGLGARRPLVATPPGPPPPFPGAIWTRAAPHRRRVPGLLPVWAFYRVLRSAAPGCRASVGTVPTRVAPRLLCVHGRVPRVVGRGLHVPSRPTGADRGAAPTRAGAAAPSACRVASSSPSNPVRLAPLVLVMGHNQRC